MSIRLFVPLALFTDLLFRVTADTVGECPVGHTHVVLVCHLFQVLCRFGSEILFGQRNRNAVRVGTDLSFFSQMTPFEGE